MQLFIHSLRMPFCYGELNTYITNLSPLITLQKKAIRITSTELLPQVKCCLQDRGNKRLDIWGKNTNQWYMTMFTARDMECFKIYELR